MPNNPPHSSTSVLFSCIDDRLVQPGAKFMAAHGNSFHPAMAGGGAAFINPVERKIALKQIVAAYLISHVKDVYLESHMDCGAYRLAGVIFDSDTEELVRLYADLDEASGYVREALLKIGAAEGEITIFTRVIDASGTLQPRPALEAVN